MVSLLAHLIGHLVTPWAGRALFRVARRWPLGFCAVPVACLGFTGWLLATVAGNRLVVALAVCMVVFYAGMLVVILVKRANGTWAAYCDEKIAGVQLLADNPDWAWQLVRRLRARDPGECHGT